MALDSAGLGKGIADVFKSEPSSGAQAAAKIAAEYDKYAKKGQAGPGLPLVSPAAKAAMEGALAGALASSVGSAAAVAAAFSSGLTAYWMSPPVPFSGGPATGVVTAVPGAGAIVGPLTGILKNTKNSPTPPVTIAAVCQPQTDPSQATRTGASP